MKLLSLFALVVAAAVAVAGQGMVRLLSQNKEGLPFLCLATVHTPLCMITIAVAVFVVPRTDPCKRERQRQRPPRSPR